jgi:hypothetical protein
MRLGTPYNSLYTPDIIIEKWSSLIWTERFDGSSEFTLTTYLVDETINALPLDSLVTLQDSDEVMIVESHTIDIDETKKLPTLKVTGRSMAMFPLENRFVEGPYQKKRDMGKSYTPVGALIVLLWNVVANASGTDVTRKEIVVKYNEDPDNGGASAALINTTYPWNTKDIIPNVCVTDSVLQSGSAQNWWVKEGMLGPQMTEIMTKNDIGLRMIRPSDLSSGKVVDVGTSPFASIGNITRTQTSGITQLRFDFYDGVDRSINQDDQIPVTFNTRTGDVAKPQYLFSVKDFKTAVEIMSDPAGADVYRNATQQAWTGMQRRVTAFDGGTPKIPDEPERPDKPGANASAAEKAKYDRAMDRWKVNHDDWKARKATILQNFADDNQDKGDRLLKKSRKVSLFSGDASALAPFKYKQHYNLGDKVTIQGDYGLSQDMLVTEYVRTQDATGLSEYPGLTLP